MRCAGAGVLIAAVLGATASPGLAQSARMRPSLDAVTYFPLRDGNRWVYEKKGPTGTSTWQAVVQTLGSSAPTPGYHVLSGYFFGPPRLVRGDPAGRVVEIPMFGGPEYLWYLLNAPVGTTWELEWAPSPLMMPIAACISGSKLRIAARDETVAVPAGVFRNVVHVEFHPPCVDAGIIGEWFAPGVGLVRRTETTIAGTVTSELVEAELGAVVLPNAPYVTSLGLVRPRYVNNLMPPVDLATLPVVRGSFTVRNMTDDPVELTFGGCKSAAIEVKDRDGETVLTARADDGGCCDCKNLVKVTLQRSSLALPFTFKLATAKGQPVPDGDYTVTVTLETVDPPSLRPSARSRVEVASVH